MGYRTEGIRNLCLVGHTGTGKTTLAESLLFAGGAIRKMGGVDTMDSVCDHTSQEHDYKHSLESAVCHFDYDGIHVNLIDTPGYPDLYGRAVAVLSGADTAVIVINAATGVELMAERMNEAALEGHLCRLVVINQCDTPEVDLEQVLANVQTRLGSQCLPLNLPSLDGGGVVDCFFQPDGGETSFASVADAHTRLIDQVVEVDDELMELYLEQDQELSPEQLHAPFEAALRNGHLVPVCFVSAKTGVGIPELVEIINRLMPNPLEGNPPEFFRDGDSDIVVPRMEDPDDHSFAHVFKVEVDPFRGRLGVVRVHQGTLRRGDQVYVGDSRKPLKIAHLYKLQGGEQVEIDAAGPGDICAIPRAESVHFDAVLHDAPDNAHFRMRSARLPPAVFGSAIRAETVDAQRLADVLALLVEEDPSLSIEQISATNETVIRCLGELHLRILTERLAGQYGITLEYHPPSIAYRETITAEAQGSHRHRKQSGGAGQFGEVMLRVRPLERGDGFRFVNEVVGGAIPYQFIPAVEKGVRQVMDSGSLAGFPMQDIEVTVYDGKHHSVDSKEIAFVVAGRKAFLDAVTGAQPILLEPWVSVHVEIPHQAMGDVAGDLSGMRGSVLGTDLLPSGRLEVRGEVPLESIQTYHSRLKSLSGGEGSFTMVFSRYVPVAAKVQSELKAAYRPREDA